MDGIYPTSRLGDLQVIGTCDASRLGELFRSALYAFPVDKGSPSLSLVSLKVCSSHPSISGILVPCHCHLWFACLVWDGGAALSIVN